MLHVRHRPARVPPHTVARRDTIDRPGQSLRGPFFSSAWEPTSSWFDSHVAPNACRV